jgi:hypothetical protein
MNRYVVLACLAFIAVPVGLMGQQSPLDLGRWRNFTDMKAVRGIAATTDSLWVATSGGLFLYIPSLNLFAKFTNSEGLSSNDLTAVAVDGTGMVWVGSSDGYINALTPATGQWREVTGIRESDRVQKAIRMFLVRGDSLFVATDFGITILQLSRREFRDTYANLGFPTQAGVNDVKISKNRIWAATDLGVASAPLDAPNLSAPTSWTTYGTAQGLPAASCSAITTIHDTIVVGIFYLFLRSAEKQSSISLADRMTLSFSGTRPEVLDLVRMLVSPCRLHRLHTTQRRRQVLLRVSRLRRQCGSVRRQVASLDGPVDGNTRHRTVRSQICSATW